MKTLLKSLAWLFLAGQITTAQEYNRVIYSEVTQSAMLIGTCNRDAFAMTDFISWFEQEYESYQPGEVYTGQLSQLSLDDVTFMIVLGTWCPDSRREVPRFFRILDDLGVPDDNIQILSLDRNKSIPGEDISGLEVYFVPTFILYRNGEEIGRIVESPENTLEEDLLHIIN